MNDLVTHTTIGRSQYINKSYVPPTVG